MIEFYTKQEIKDAWNGLKLDDRIYRKWFAKLVNYIIRPVIFTFGMGILFIFWLLYSLCALVMDLIDKIVKKGWNEMQLDLNDKVLNELLYQVSELQIKIENRINDLYRIGAFCGECC